MNPLTIVAHLTAHSDQVELLKTELQKVIPKTLAEQGCVQYDLHQDKENPAHFMFFEVWQSRELWVAHTQSEHIAELRIATKDAVTERTIFEMNKV